MWRSLSVLKYKTLGAVEYDNIIHDRDNATVLKYNPITAAIVKA